MISRVCFGTSFHRARPRRSHVATWSAASIASYRVRPRSRCYRGRAGLNVPAAAVVALVAGRSRVVEHVHHAGEASRSGSRAVSSALRRRRGYRLRGRAKGNPGDVVEKGQARGDFLHDAVGDGRFVSGQLQSLENDRRASAAGAHLENRHSAILTLRASRAAACRRRRTACCQYFANLAHTMESVSR